MAALTSAMTALLSDEKSRLRIGAAARELIDRAQTLPVIIDQWTAAFERLCRTPR